MTIENSPQLKSISKHCIVEIGNLYFFDNFLVAEFNKGIDLDFESFKDTQKLINAFYGNKPFGFVANRVNAYSINLIDADKLNTVFKNVVAYATVTYNTLSEKVSEIESHFFNFNRKAFKSLENAMLWTDEEIEKNKLRLG